MKRIIVGTCLCLLVSSRLLAGANYDAASDFSTNSNPNGVWSYGYSANLGGAFTPYTSRGMLPEKIEYWRVDLYGNVPAAFHNPGTVNVTNAPGTVVWGPNQLSLHPGNAGEYSRVRFIAPEGGVYRAQGSFVGMDMVGTTTDAHVLVRGGVFLNLSVTGYGPTSARAFDTNVFLNAGDPVDFAVGTGGNGFMYDSTGLSAQISLTTNAANPVISSQPQSQSAVIGASVAFTVGASGPAPLSYQWRFNGDAITGATNASLTLPSVQLTHAGKYSVVVTNLAGSVTSDDAVLTVTTLACAPVPQGLVSWWSGEGSALDNVGVHDGTTNGGLSYVAGKTGQAFRFNGANSSVDLGSWFTFQSFSLSMWVNPAAAQVQYADILDSLHSDRANWVLQQNSTVQNQYYFAVPIAGATAYSTFTLASDRWQHLVITRDTNNHNRVYVDGALVAEAQDAGPVNYTNQSFRLGGHASSGRNWSGQLDELAVFDRALTTNEIASIYHASGAGMCPLPLAITQQPVDQTVAVGDTASFGVKLMGTPPFNYQWRLDGQGLDGATNSSLVIPDVQLAQAGNYSVVVANAAGSTVSSNAVLTVTNLPPSITSQPQPVTVGVGGTATFSVSAGGSRPFTYQWRWNGSPLGGATNASLSLTNVQLSQAGAYSVLVSNLYGMQTSSLASLTVTTPPVPLTIVSTTNTSGWQVEVPVRMVANGNENAVSFSVTFMTGPVLKFAGVTLGNVGPGATLVFNTNQLAQGRVGIAVSLPAGATFAPGTQDVVKVNFNTAVLSYNQVFGLNFTTQPLAVELADPTGRILPTSLKNGSLTLLAADLEADTIPRPSGNRSLNLSDWVQAGRFAAGLDIPQNGPEFQRADCAPRDSRGDGQIKVTDWVQAGRFYAGLDPAQAVGGPTSPPQGAPLPLGDPQPGPGTREVRLADKSCFLGQSVVVPVRLDSQGDENAAGFTLVFDTSKLAFAGAVLGSGASNASLNLNTNQAAAGRVGAVLALATGSAFPSGEIELLNVTFTPLSAAASLVNFGDIPVARAVSNPTADELPAGFVAGTVTVQELPRLQIGLSGPEVILAWPTVPVGFNLESREASLPAGSAWTGVTNAPTTNGNAIQVIVPATGPGQLYRLKSN